MNEIEVRIKGRIDRGWSEWFDNLDLTYTRRGETVLRGPIRDQSALLGLLNKIADLGLLLTAVTITASSRTERGGERDVKAPV